MDSFPPFQKLRAIQRHDLHGPSSFAAHHSFCPNKLRRTTHTGEVDLRVSVAEYMHVGGLVIIRKDDDS
jgi:hypothetical protein